MADISVIRIAIDGRIPDNPSTLITPRAIRESFIDVLEGLNTLKADADEVEELKREVLELKELLKAKTNSDETRE